MNSNHRAAETSGQHRRSYGRLHVCFAPGPDLNARGGESSFAALPALWSYDWSAALLAFPWQENATSEEETEDYGITYLRHMMTYNGKAQCMLAPDMIPQEAGK